MESKFKYIQRKVIKQITLCNDRFIQNIKPKITPEILTYLKLKVDLEYLFEKAKTFTTIYNKKEEEQLIKEYNNDNKLTIKNTIDNELSKFYNPYVSNKKPKGKRNSEWKKKVSKLYKQ